VGSEEEDQKSRVAKGTGRIVHDLASIACDPPAAHTDPGMETAIAVDGNVPSD
jgi:hypothetical protein